MYVDRLMACVRPTSVSVTYFQGGGRDKYDDLVTLAKYMVMVFIAFDSTFLFLLSGRHRNVFLGSSIRFYL